MNKERRGRKEKKGREGKGSKRKRKGREGKKTKGKEKKRREKKRDRKQKTCQKDMLLTPQHIQVSSQRHYLERLMS